MKKYIFIKPTAAARSTAHLYEHLFCFEISKLMKENHLFHSLDYTLGGMTYTGSLVTIEFTALNKTAEKLAKKIQDVKLDFTNTNHIEKGIKHLQAEMLAAATYHQTKLINQLDKIQRLNWQTYSKFNHFNLRGGHTSGSELKLTKTKKTDFTKIKISIILEPKIAKDTKLSPLAFLLLNTLRDTLAEELANKYYYYITDTQNYYGKSNNTKATALLTHHNELSQDIPAQLAECKAWLHKITQNISSGIATMLAQKDIFELSEEVMQYTGLLLGPSGWTNLATKENIQKLTENLQVEFK